MGMTRRQFLQTTGLSSMALYSAASSAPMWIARSARALASEIADGKRLVIVQQGGGNDGLNTVIPYQDDLYNGDVLRPSLHITSGLEDTILDDLNAFNPRLARLYQWWLKGNLAVVQNVGYPNPNFSHFISTDFWERGTSPGTALHTTQGWISRFFDNQCGGVPPDQVNALSMLAGGMAFLPGTLDGSDFYRPPAVPEFDAYNILANPNAAGQHILNYIELVNGTNTLVPEIDFLQRSSLLAQASVDDMALAAAVPTINPYPEGSLGTGLDMVSKVIRGGFETPIFYVTQGGYDTHANQFATDPATTGDHPALLDTFDNALDAFLADMETSGMLDDVLILTFSEFGRRVPANGSLGTDHGASNCLFVMGGQVNKGIYGGQPDLADLQQGNLRHKIDFRSVYSRVLRDWLGVEPDTIFGATDFNNPEFNIAGGLEQIPFIGSGKLGDVDGDGKVTSADVQHVVNVSLGKSSPYNTDLDNSGATDATDIQEVVSRVLGG